MKVVFSRMLCVSALIAGVGRNHDPEREDDDRSQRGELDRCAEDAAKDPSTDSRIEGIGRSREDGEGERVARRQIRRQAAREGAADEPGPSRRWRQSEDAQHQSARRPQRHAASDGKCEPETGAAIVGDSDEDCLQEIPRDGRWHYGQVTICRASMGRR